MDRIRHELTANHKRNVRQQLSALHRVNKEEKELSQVSKAAIEKIEREIAAAGKTIQPAAGATASTTAADNSSKAAVKPAPPRKPQSATATKEAAVPVTPLFAKTVKVKETETTKWKAQEKTLAADVDIGSLTGEAPSSDKPKGKSLFKKRQVKKT